ncbi:MAG: hypothetical protein ACYCSQ_00200 [bacterium]
MEKNKHLPHFDFNRGNFENGNYWKWIQKNGRDFIFFESICEIQRPERGQIRNYDYINRYAFGNK